MKKSNKILLGGLITIILVILAVDVALYARYKSGNYTSFSEKMSEEATHTQEFANTRQVDIRNFKSVSLYVGDRVKVEQFDNVEGNVVLTEKDGVVQLLPKDTHKNDDLFGDIAVYVPEGSLVTSYDAMIRIEGANGKKIQSLQFKPSGGRLIFMENKAALQIDSLAIDATNKASIELGNAQIDKLAIRLNASALTDEKALINQLQLDTDTASRVDLQSRNLLKLTTKTAAHE